MGFFWYGRKMVMNFLVLSILFFWFWVCYSGKVSFWVVCDFIFGFLDYFCEFVDLFFCVSGVLGNYGDVVGVKLEL